MWTSLLLLGATLFLFYKWWTHGYNYWSSRGFPSIPGHFPWGSKADIVKLKKYPGYNFQEIYNQLAPHPYGGIYILRQHVLILRDLEIIKAVLQRDALKHFMDRIINFGDPVNDPLSQHLFSLQGEKWRALRVKLTPTFTSGKLKVMFNLFEMCALQLDSKLKILADSSQEVDIKDLIARFTTDIIANCAFGLAVNSVDNPNDEFRQVGLKTLTPDMPLNNRLQFLLVRLFPPLEKKMKFVFFPKDATEYFLNVVKNAIRYREENNIRRNDFLDLLIQLKNKGHLESDIKESADDENIGSSQPIELTEELLAAQCFVFFLAGYETSSSVMSYCFFELVKHPDIQERVRKEILKVSAKHGGITYAALQEMPYLEQVIFETQRMYPTLPTIVRTCTSRYQLPDDPSRVIEKETKVLIPVYAIHHDPQYYPDPEKFDPERFSPENKAKIPHFAFLPFGEGPRICIGMRFGMLQTKMGIASVLSKYRLSESPNTQDKLEFTGVPLISTVRGGIYIKAGSALGDIRIRIRKYEYAQL